MHVKNTTRLCPVCQTDFATESSSPQIYCSRACAARDQFLQGKKAANGYAATPKQLRICPQCRVAFLPSTHADPKVFCSRDCANAAARTTLCPRCRIRDIELGGMCRQCDAERQRGYRAKLRAEVIAAYGGKCACCGEVRDEFLALDHANGDGATHRREIAGALIYRWARQNGYPATLQLLCHNCNLSLSIRGYCPHGNLPVRPVLARGNPRL